MAKLSYTWQKGKRKIIAEIAPLDKHYIFQRECEMYIQMGLAGFKLVNNPKG